MGIQIEKIKESVNITDYARQLGFTVKRVGSFYTLKEHDSIRIDPRKNMFIQNSTGKGGSVIDFAMTFENMTFTEAVKSLDKMCRGEEKPAKEITAKENRADEKDGSLSKKLELPPKDSNMKNVFAYLIKTRKIDSRVVQELVERKMIYQDKHKNCVFVSYKEGRPVFACKRGTNTDKRFVGDLPGNDYRHGFLMDNKSNRLVVTESVIDAMSFMTFNLLIKGSGDKCDYLALSGTGKFEEMIKYHIGSGKYNEIIIALDNDAAGVKATENIKELLDGIGYNGKIQISLPELKDWNEELIRATDALKEKNCIEGEEEL